MSASGPRFCPRCGTERVGEMRFCPNCGMDLEQVAAGDRPAIDAAPPANDTPVAAPTALTPIDRGAVERSAWRPLLGPGLLVLLAVAALWFVGIGPFSRDAGDPGPLAGADSPTPTSPFLPAVTAQPSFLASPGLTAPPVGLTILSPADGAVVGAREVTVIGTAPPGLRITQDISFGFDRHATADGTGHWAIGIELTEGENQLKFRIGDDPSTTQTLRVTYVAPAAQ
jgi:hypothetical protein